MKSEEEIKKEIEYCEFLKRILAFDAHTYKQFLQVRLDALKWVLK